MIRCVVFDFDGTLVDSNQIKHKGFLEIAEGFDNGTRLMEAILRRANAGDRYWVFDEFVSVLSVKVDAGKLVDSYSQLCEKRITEAPEIPGARSALARLSEEGKLLYVNSATPIEHLAKLIHLRKMEHWFNGIYGAPQGKGENLGAILAACGIQGDELLMVGDSESDRDAARKNRCHFIGVRNGENNFLQRPPHLIDDLRSLPACLGHLALLNRS